MTLPEEQVDEKSPAEKLMASRLRSSQFRLTTIFGMMLLVGILMAIPRIIGFDYRWYFQFLYMILYGCTPLMAWLTYALLSKRLGAWRLVASSVVVVGLVVPFWSLFAWKESLSELILMITAACIFFWLPQILCLWMLWFFVFRPSPRQR